MDVSVVIPTRNRSRLLASTIRSVLGQRDVDLEIIVVDEASTDDTLVVLSAFGDARLRVIRHETPHGVSAARNHGTAEARGEWVAFLDDDDLWAPDKLVLQIAAAEQAGRDWVYAGAVNIENGQIVYGCPPLPPEEVVSALPRFNPIPGGASNIIGRRTAWLRAGPFDTRLQNPADWEMSIRLAKNGPPAWVCRPLIAKRVHPSNMSLDILDIVRATRLVEALHGIKADWGRLHRWLAERYLRSGQRREALKRFARAAFSGQLRGVTTDLGTILRRRMDRMLGLDPRAADRNNPWHAEAAKWLRDLGETIR
jgi:glycosyltransferase involved in cell wall biosynthesis